MDQTKPKPYLSAAEIAAAPEMRVRHPWNPKSEIFLRHLSSAAGLERSVLTLARLPPGKESFAYHTHERDEEYLFILSGRGRAEIGDQIVEVAPGDFLGFTPLGAPHLMSNPYDEDLVYLMGGERSGLDVGHFPRLGRRILFGPSGIFAMENAAMKEMAFSDFMTEPTDDDTPTE